MTPLQKFIIENGVEAVERLGINVYRHPDLPLVGFKYSQIESPKTDEVVRWARGTVLEDVTWNLIAQPFVRFFNWGEHQEEMTRFNWNGCSCTSKEDGSLIICYWYRGEWHVNTSGSFGLGKVQRIGEQSWRDLFWETFATNGGKKRNLVSVDDGLTRPTTYIFELCTPINKVVRTYAKPTLFLLGVFSGDEEIDPYEVCAVSDLIGIKRPHRFDFRSADHAQDYLREQAMTDPTFEGIVARDVRGTRFKIKSDSYVALHRLKDNNNIARTDRLIEIALASEQDEVLTYFPELADEFGKVKARLDAEYAGLCEVWERYKSAPDQKSFAMAVKAHQYSGLLFQARKAPPATLEALWRSSGDAIIKRWSGK